MKRLISVLALAAASAVSAAPQTLYFAGNIVSATVYDSAGMPIPTPPGGAFSGSITVDGSKGTPLSPYTELGASRSANGLAEDPIVSNYVFNYGGISYSKLAVPVNGGTEQSSVSKWHADVNVPPELYNGGYQLGIDTVIENGATASGDGFYAQRTRFLFLDLIGPFDFPGDIWDLATLPDLSQFYPWNSSITFVNTNFNCQYVQGSCVEGTVTQDENSMILDGRFTYLSTTPLAITELPEPGSFALVGLGIAGLLGIRRQRARNASSV